MMLRKYIWLLIFGIAFGYLECAVVVYLRDIAYPSGFKFPLTPIEPFLALTEIGREAATLVMLIAIGVLTGRTKTERFGIFLFVFAVWDIFYYVFLKLLLNWPQSLLTWDILFLIPTTWVGPVFAPILLSLIMAAFAIVITLATNTNSKARIANTEWVLLIAGSLLVIVSFTLDYTRFVLQQHSFGAIFHLDAEQIKALTVTFVPDRFYYGLFFAGVAGILTGIGRFAKRHKIVFS